ncbi:MAG: hypothetical protein SGCHY_004046, partial [Lobulomycetales sp.]
LEVSGVFVNDDKEFSYEETGWLKDILYASGCRVSCPVYEKLSQVEEARLGNAGIRKESVGQLDLVGRCLYGCASVELEEMTLRKPDGVVVWQWRRSDDD